jgi:curved DNA-binding protein CbpA
LRPTAPPELVSAAHRCLAKLNHPDAGGNTTTMQRINGAVEQIREAS